MKKKVRNQLRAFCIFEKIFFMQSRFIYWCITILFVIFFIPVQAQNSDSLKTVKAKSRPEDQIEQYFFVLLKTGPKQDFDSAQKAELFKGHMANINRLYYDGIIKVAGPFGKNELTWRGIFVFDCKTKEEAAKIAIGIL